MPSRSRTLDDFAVPEEAQEMVMQHRPRIEHLFGVELNILGVLGSAQSPDGAPQGARKIWLQLQGHPDSLQRAKVEDSFNGQGRDGGESTAGLNRRCFATRLNVFIGCFSIPLTVMHLKRCWWHSPLQHFYPHHHLGRTLRLMAEWGV